MFEFIMIIILKIEGPSKLTGFILSQGEIIDLIGS